MKTADEEFLSFKEKCIDDLRTKSFEITTKVYKVVGPVDR